MHEQTELEEKWNWASHAFGAVLGIVGLLLLVYFQSNKTPNSLWSIFVYGLSVIVLFTASALYHYEKDDLKKRRLRILDHCSIYLLIAGTYTPVLLINLIDFKGWLLFYVVWSIALVGIGLKLFFTGKFGLFSTLLYLLMGWLIVFDFKALSEQMHPNGISLLVAGGIAYMVGIVFYSVHRIPYNHVIWHFFVLVGAILHYCMIFFYVI